MKKDLDYNNFRKVVHAALWFDDKIALSRVIKESYHKGFWSDAGGKVEKGESLTDAVQRELKEETGLWLAKNRFELEDCFIYPKRQIKTFLFSVRFMGNKIDEVIKNTEPHKQSNWKLFTVREALKLMLMPSVRYYLESLNK